MQEPKYNPRFCAELRERRLGWSASFHLVNGQAAVGGGTRGLITGWGAGAARANRDYLQSIDYAKLPAGGYAVTLTTRTLMSPAEWRQTRRRLCWWLAKRGASAHWVVEWQRRGVPHLHLAVWGVRGADVVAWWLAHTDGGRSGQHCRRIDRAAVWAKYCAKHGARGLGHYQRNRASLVGAWLRESAGRMWGHMGAKLKAAYSAPRVWSYCGGEADYAKVAKRLRRILGGGDNQFFRGCGAWASFGVATDGFMFAIAGSNDPPQTGESIELQAIARLEAAGVAAGVLGNERFLRGLTGAG